MKRGYLSLTIDDANTVALVGKDGNVIAEIKRNERRHERAYIVIKADPGVRIVRCREGGDK